MNVNHTDSRLDCPSRNRSNMRVLKCNKPPICPNIFVFLFFKILFMTGSVQHRHVGNNTTIEQEEENPTAYRGITHENSHLYTHKCNVHSHVYTRQCCFELTAAAAPSARPSLDVFPYFFPKANATIEEEEKETSESRLRVKRNIYRCCIH